MTSLRQNPAFAHLSEEMEGRFVATATRVRFPKAVTLMAEGEVSFDVYVVETGVLRLQRDTPYGRFALAELGPGSIVGEASFIDREERSGEVEVLEPASLLLLSPVALESQMEKDPRFSLALYWAFWKSLAEKLRNTNERLDLFFGAEDTKARPETDSQDVPTGSFRVDMAAKRELFREKKLSNMEINFLASLSREKKFPAGEQIFREGDPGDYLYIVLEGKVMISRFVTGAGEEALAFLERGDFFGEMGLIDKKPRSADAKAHGGEAVVLRIPAHVIEGILDPEKVSSLRLLKLLCIMVSRRLRELDEKIIGWFILSGGSAGRIE